MKTFQFLDQYVKLDYLLRDLREKHYHGISDPLCRTEFDSSIGEIIVLYLFGWYSINQCVKLLFSQRDCWKPWSFRTSRVSVTFLSLVSLLQLLTERVGVLLAAQRIHVWFLILEFKNETCLKEIKMYHVPSTSTAPIHKDSSFAGSMETTLLCSESFQLHNCG